MRPARYLIPLLPNASDYTALGRSWRGDLLAGLTVGIVALPLALAFGVSSGAGAEAGLVTAIVAGLVASVFGGSNVQVSGPTGAMVVVLAPIVAAHGVAAVAVVSFMAGLIVLALGLAKLGRLVGLIPWPVIEGFTLGIAVIIFLQQVPAALDSHGDSTNAAIAALQSAVASSWPQALWSIAAALIVAVVMLAAPRIHKQLPGSILAIILVTMLAQLVHAPLKTIGQLPPSLPRPGLPEMNLPMVESLLLPAVTVAGLAAIESLLSARVAASVSDTGPYNGDRELVGQGLASIASGLFGGMPATGAIARTAVNIRSGGRTRLAAITHALVLLVVVYFATTLVSQIPLAALAGVLVVTATRMVSPATVRSVLRASRPDAVIFILTALVTVSVDLIVAVGIGIAAASIVALRRLAKSSAVRREELPGPAEAGDERIALFRLDGELFFGAAERVIDEVSSVKKVSVVILRLSQLRDLDASGARALAELVTDLERRGITVLIKGVQPGHLDLATNVGLLTALDRGDHLFEELGAAVAHARQHSRTGDVHAS